MHLIISVFIYFILSGEFTYSDILVYILVVLGIIFINNKL